MNYMNYMKNSEHYQAIYSKIILRKLKTMNHIWSVMMFFNTVEHGLRFDEKSPRYQVVYH